MGSTMLNPAPVRSGRGCRCCAGWTPMRWRSAAMVPPCRLQQPTRRRVKSGKQPIGVAQKKKGHAAWACPPSPSNCERGLEPGELVADAARHHHGVAEVPQVVAVDVQAGAPLVPRVPDAGTDAELHI